MTRRPTHYVEIDHATIEHDIGLPWWAYAAALGALALFGLLCVEGM